MDPIVIKAQPSHGAHAQPKTFEYDFPIIHNISDLLPAIKDSPEFAIAVKEGYTVVNYKVAFEDTFPPIKVAGGSAKMRAERALHNALRRECRGIIFDSETGDILRRPYHKFFNINERAETLASQINLSKSHAILDKLDGSMIAPFIVNDKMIWGTKMGATDVAEPVEEFVRNNPKYKHLAFTLMHYGHGYTPIFEWCSRQQRIVLDHPEEQLILTAVRDMRSGEYYNHTQLIDLSEAYDIPIVNAFKMGTDTEAFIDHVRDLTDVEGYVVRFHDGHMVKIKCDWYVQIHRAKDSLMQDRNIVEMILNNELDDVKAHLPEEDRERLIKFEMDFHNELTDRCENLYRLAYDLIEVKKIDRKTFALEHASKLDHFTKSAIFSVWDDVSSYNVDAVVVKTVGNNLSKTVKYDEMKAAWFPSLEGYNA